MKPIMQIFELCLKNPEKPFEDALNRLERENSGVRDISVILSNLLFIFKYNFFGFYLIKYITYIKTKIFIINIIFI